MPGSTEYNKIVSTVTSVTQDYQHFSSPDSCIVIDTSNNNIGINNINPQAHIDINQTDAEKILKINGFSYLTRDGKIRREYLQGDVPAAQITQVQDSIQGAPHITISGGHQIGLQPSLNPNNYLVIDPSGIDITSLDGQHKGTVQIRGNLEVLGNTTTIYSSTIDISDKNITLATSAPNPEYLNNAGIDISNVATFRYNNEKWNTNIGLNISGDLSVNNIDVSNILIYEQLDVSNVTISNNLLIYNQLDVSNVTISNNLLIYNQLDVSNVTISNNLLIYNQLDVSNVTISNNLLIYNQLDVSNVTISNNLLIYNQLDVSNVTISNNLLIYNQLDVSYIEISNNALIYNKLDVSYIEISNNALIYNKLDVSYIEISNNALIHNQLDVSNVTISNNLLIKNQLDVSYVDVYNTIKINCSDISYYIYFGDPSTNIIGTDTSKIDSSYSYSYSYVHTQDISSTDNKINLPNIILPIGGQHIMHIDNSGGNSSYILQGWADSNHWSKNNKRLCNFESELEIENNKHLLLTVTRMNNLYFYSGSVYSFND